jgi:hypothetical protein
VKIVAPSLNISQKFDSYSTSFSEMYVDMTLAASYKPVLVCITKMCILMIFHYTSVPLLFVMERYALLLSTLYIDNWMSCEYIINTNSCLSVVAVSLLVHELRDAGIQEREHGGMAHTVMLSLLVSTNTLVLTLGEQPLFTNWLFPFFTRVTGVSADTAIDPGYQCKQPRQNIHQSGYSNGTMMCLVVTCALLVGLSTCAFTISAQDPILTNLRVFSFTVFSVVWMYTVNYRNLRYSSVASFSPCLIRFSSVLFLTPTPFAVGGIIFMACSLFTTCKFIQKPFHEKWSTTDTENDLHVHSSHTDNVSVVIREKPPGSVISHRTPVVASEKSESSHKHSSNSTREVVRDVSALVVPSGIATVAPVRPIPVDIVSVCDVGIQDTTSLLPESLDVDYDTLFQQVMTENAVQ